MKSFMNKILFIAIVVAVAPLLLPPVVAAQASPIPFPFPSCTAPSGTVIASYSEGVHGIVGDAGVYTGSDTVYLLGNDNVTQCFCPSDGGSGIQTNWLNASGFSQSDIDSYISQDWIYVITGVVWGLSDHPYLAKNSSFICSPAGGGEGGSGSSGSGGSEEGEVLGVSRRTVAMVDPSVVVAGEDIAVLPATGESFMTSLLAFFAQVFAYIISL